MQLFDPTNQNFRSIPVTPSSRDPFVVAARFRRCPGDEC